ncbi:hypothetical protein LDY98_27575, partial [Pseudomonas aeruginosa]|nr:hypothetical protein [Pseudomonas aeruginosa]
LMARPIAPSRRRSRARSCRYFCSTNVPMSLTRTSSGALGVRAMGGGGSQINVEVNIASDGSANVSSSQPGLDQFGRDIGTFVEQKYRQLLARDLRRDGAIGRAING